jgi:hypothetical protein
MHAAVSRRFLEAPSQTGGWRIATGESIRSYVASRAAKVAYAAWGVRSAAWGVRSQSAEAGFAAASPQDAGLAASSLNLGL